MNDLARQLFQSCTMREENEKLRIGRKLKVAVVDRIIQMPLKVHPVDHVVHFLDERN